MYSNVIAVRYNPSEFIGRKWLIEEITCIFQQLSQQNQRKLIDSAQRMLTQQEKSHG